MKFNGIYDVVNNLFEDKILNYDIDYIKGKFELFGFFIKMGIKFNKNIFLKFYFIILRVKLKIENII